MSRRARTPRSSSAAFSPVRLAALALGLLLAAPIPAALADPGPEGDVPQYAYTADGQSVEGGASLAQAPPITPGIYRDSFERGSQDVYEDGSVKYYRVAVEDGQRVHAATTVTAPPYPGGLPEDSEPLELAVSFLTAGGQDCLDGTGSVGETAEGDGPVTATAVSDVLGPDGCAGEELFLRVARKGSRAADEPLPVEIQVAIQPAGIGGGSPSVSEEIEDDGALPVSPANSEPVELGRSFATATPLEPGSYVVELVPGETGLVSIQVQEGQRLRWRTEVTTQPAESPGTIGLRAYNAARATVTVRGGTWTLNSANPIEGGGMAAPVDLGNRSSELPAVQSAWLPGTHTVQLQRLQRPGDADPAGDGPVTLILTLEVEGEVADDAAEGTVLELGETTSTAANRNGLFGIDADLGRIALFAGAGLLVLMALVTGVAGILVLRLRRN